jgi:hypothetical protein
MITFLYPFIDTVANLQPASNFQGAVAITTDGGLYLSNGIIWTPIEQTNLPILSGVFTFATLPPAVANPNTYAATSDKGAVYSNGAAWQLLFNPTNATVNIATNSPLPSGVNGSAYSTPITVTNATAPVTWSLIPVNAQNTWAINSTTGVITGTPSHTTTTVPDVIAVQVIDATSAGDQSIFAISVAAGVLTPAATPTFSPAAGTYSVSQSVTITCSTGSSSIFYTTNGSTPSTSSTPYTGPVNVTATSTLKAIATASGFAQSAVGSAAYTITTSGAFYKFAGSQGDYMMPPQYGISNSASTANDLGWIKKLVANPATGFIMQRHWSDLDNGSTIDNNTAHAIAGTGNFTGFNTEVGAVFNLLQTYAPGSYFGLYANTIEIWKAPAGNGVASVPNYIKNAASGAITIANTFGSGSTTAYTMYRYPSLGNTCGYLFYAFNSPAAVPPATPINYGFNMAMYNDPAVMNAFANFFQALSMFQLGATTPYSSGTTYGLGVLVTSGGTTYCSIQAGNVGQAVTNTAFWLPTANTYSGMTLDQCPLFIFIGDNTETSAIFNQGPAVAGNTTSQNLCSYQNWYGGYNGSTVAKKAAFPHTVNGLCQSFLIEGTDGVAQPPSTWTTMMASQNSVQGVSYSQADISQTAFTAGSQHIQNAATAYVGLDPSANYGGTLPPFGSFATNYVSVMPTFEQVQPEDYGSAVTGTIVGKLANTMSFFKATHRFWSTQDTSFSFSAWPTIQAGFKAAVAVTTARPSNLP